MSISDLIARIKNFSKKTWIYIGSGLIVLIIIVNFIVVTPPNIAFTEVKREEFVVDLTVSGEINALNSNNISVPRMRRRFSLQISERK